MTASSLAPRRSVMKRVHNWISVFRFYNNCVRANEEIGRAPLQDDALPEYIRFIKLIQEGDRLS